MEPESHVIDRLNDLLAEGQKLFDSRDPNTSGGWLPPREYEKWRSGSLVKLRNTFGETHPYSIEFVSVTDKGRGVQGLLQGTGILEAALESVQNGDLQTTREQMTASVLANFLDMADFVLSDAEGHPAAAAMLTGAVLENGLRNAAEKAGITKQLKSIGVLQQELVKADVISGLEAAEVSLWQKLRDSAVHGKFDDVDRDKTTTMVAGVRTFLTELLNRTGPMA